MEVLHIADCTYGYMYICLYGAKLQQVVRDPWGLVYESGPPYFLSEFCLSVRYMLSVSPYPANSNYIVAYIMQHN